MSIIEYLGFAFLGGVILNVMPCVLPVLTLKVFHTIEAFGEQDHRPRLHSLAYTAGTTITFSLFAAVIIAVRASGEVLGWGMHFQHPPFVAALTALIFVFGLNSLGVFEIAISGRDSHKSGVLGTFLNGIFAAVMSTPCTAPFLGTAAVFALAADTAWYQTLVLFAMIGVGLAFPYALIGFVPAVAKILPKPGNWMVTFKHIMGFTLLATSVWLFGALQSQLTPTSANWFLAFLLLLAVGLWATNRFAALQHSALRRRSVWVVVIAVVSVAGARMLEFERRVDVPVEVAFDAPVVKNGKINWVAFDARRVQTELARNRPVFMDYTADWCAACKTNEKLFLETDLVRKALAETNILPMKADMTNDNEELDRWLSKLGRSGIPAYVTYLPKGDFDLLPEVITSEMVANSLRKAAKTYPPIAKKD